MATQTGVVASKVLILVGAGLTGSIILRNGRLVDIISELQELLKGTNEGEASSSHFDTTQLASQIRHLAHEIRELTISRPVTVLTENSHKGNVLSCILPAAAVGALAYCYMRWKGLSFSDVMFVTKHNMANAVASVSKQLEQVSDALAATKKHLTQRLENLDGKVDEERKTSLAIMSEVGDVKDDLSQMGFDIESIRSMITGLEGKLGLLEQKQDFTNVGLWSLCQIADGSKSAIDGKFLQEASEKLKVSQTSTYNPGNLLQGLHFLTEDAKINGVGDSKPKPLAAAVEGKTMKPNIVRTTTMHRSSVFSVRKDSLAL